MTKFKFGDMVYFKILKVQALIISYPPHRLALSPEYIIFYYNPTHGQPEIRTKVKEDELYFANPAVREFLIQGALASFARDPIPDSDLDDEQPIAMTIRTTLGVARKLLTVMQDEPELEERYNIVRAGGSRHG